MVGWRHRLHGHEFERALGVGDGQGGLARCSPWGRRESGNDWATELKKQERKSRERVGGWYLYIYIYIYLMKVASDPLLIIYTSFIQNQWLTWSYFNFLSIFKWPAVSSHKHLCISFTGIFIYMSNFSLLHYLVVLEVNIFIKLGSGEGLLLCGFRARNYKTDLSI